MPSTPISIISSKKRRTLLGSAPSNSVVFVVTRKPRCQSSLHAFDGYVIAAFAADGKIVMFSFTVHVNREAEVFARLEEMQLLLQQQRIRAQINVLLARHQSLYDLLDLGMHERLAARNGHGRRAAFINGPEALLRRKLALQNVGRILDFAAAGTGEITPEQRLEHENKRIALPSGKSLLQDVGRHRPHLRYGHTHRVRGESIPNAKRPICSMSMIPNSLTAV